MSPRSFKVIAVLISFLSVGALIAPRAAHAEDPETLIKQGVELRRKGQNARAEGYFRRAYELAATPRTTGQLGLCELAVGKYTEAEAHLTDALASDDAWINEHRKNLEDSLAHACEKLFRVVLTAAPSETTFSVDGAKARALPANASLYVAPGPRAIQLTAPGHKPSTLHVEGSAGQSRQIAVDMPAIVEPIRTPPAAAAPPKAMEPSAPATESPPVVAPPATPSPPSQPEAVAPGRGFRIAGIVVGATGVAAAVVGGVLYAQGASKKSNIESAAKNGGTFNPSDGNWESLRNAGVGCLVVGGVAIAGGAALYLVGKTAAGPELNALSFVPLPGLGLLSYARSF